jgi:glyoxylase-like metal-dependent hydrolase (beta-lactamase superfamily II)
MQGVWQITDYSNEVDPTVDMYLIEGSDRALLVDAGDSKGDLKGFIRELTEKPIDLCITHGHGDHAAAFSQFENVYLAHKDIHILQTLFGFDIDKSMLHDLRGGEMFYLGGCMIEVIALPGHTQGSVVLLDSERQLLFTSDGLGTGVLWMQLPHCTSIDAYAKELNKLEKRVENMKDLKIFSGHDCQRFLGYGKKYITDLRILTEGIVSGDIVGKPTENPDDFFGGLSASYGLVTDLIYKPNNIYIN